MIFYNFIIIIIFKINKNHVINSISIDKSIDLYLLHSHRLENLTMYDKIQRLDYNCINWHNEIGRRIRCCIQLHERIRL
jgi:hypothetical protein